MIKEKIDNLIKEALLSLGIEAGGFIVEHPTDLKMGDYSANVGIKTGKAHEIYTALRQAQGDFDFIEKIEIAEPGFINFYLSKEFFKQSLGEIIEKGENFGKSEHAKGLKVIVEYTDANPFKELHIGHLMSNAIGEAIARTVLANGAEVRRANYQGDVGMHVAKALWKGDYALGAKAFEVDPQAKEEIQELNKKIYERSSPELNEQYDKGRKESLDKFEEIYKRLGTKFDYYFFESENGDIGKKIVMDNVGKVFEESEGAIIFKGSHTRVFINSKGLPTYEAKDLGNAINKYDKYPYDLSVVVTGNEIKDYFRVVLEAMEKVSPELALKTKHLPHGMLRLPTGKMSSRTGNVITAEELIEEVKKRTKGDEQVAIGAIKYMILRQVIGHDIIFDIEKSVSTEGDSGVYLQYAHARANSILEKAGARGNVQHSVLDRGTHEVERLLYRFPEIVERAGAEYAPNYITTYLTELASSFNNFYANEQVIGDSPESQYRLAIVEAFKNVMKNGLNILGIPAPERM